MNNALRILIIVFLISVTAVILFYVYISIQFGIGMAEVAKVIVEFRLDLEDTIPTFRDTLFEEVKLIIGKEIN